MKKLLLILIAVFALRAESCLADSTFNYNKMTETLRTDIDHFSQSFRDGLKDTANFVPIEANVGKFFMSALSGVSRAIYGTLLPFLNVLVIALFAFWVLMESWNMMGPDGKSDYWGLTIRIVKRGAMAGVWLWILNNDPAEIFMWLMAPVISIGTAASNLIMDGASSVVNIVLPDTCAAIHNWMGADDSMIIGGSYAADLLCVPTRVATYFYGFVATGLELMALGLVPGSNGLIFIMGLAIVALFVYNIWKFALAALGVIVDLFFVLLFLPFTAVRECFSGKDTEYNGVFRKIWDEFVGFVNGASLSSQFVKFFNAVIYFIVLSVISAICIILLAAVNGKQDIAGILIIGCLVAYLMGKTDEYAKRLSGNIDDGSNLGNAIGSTLSSIGNNIAKKGKNVVEFGKKVVGAISKAKGSPQGAS